MLSKGTPNLQHLLLRSCDIGPAGGKILADGITAGVSDRKLLLTHLDLGSNRGLGDEAGAVRE
jgi:Ran GTPase-activating protein (RanGAP) involved in mRNA processing and transport